MEACMFYTLIISVLHLNYSLLYKACNDVIKDCSVYIYGGGTVIISCINIYLKPSLYLTEQTILYSTYGTILNYILLMLIGGLNAFSFILSESNLKNYKDNPSKLIVLCKSDILITSIFSIYLAFSPVRIVDVVFPSIALGGIYYIENGSYMYDKIDIENPELLVNTRNYICNKVYVYTITTISTISSSLKDVTILYMLSHSVNVLYVLQGYFTGSFIIHYIFSNNNRKCVDCNISFVIIIGFIYHLMLFKSYLYFINIGNIKTILISNTAFTTLISKFVFQLTELYDLQCIGIILISVSTSGTLLFIT